MRKDLIELDGSEGGGQILRSALSLSMTSGQPLRIRLAAPTGKAAARLSESIGQQVRALPLAEDVLQATPRRGHYPAPSAWQPSGYPALPHHRDNPLALDVLVVDEASMIDLEMMASLLDALPPQARLILLGDKDQLASVEAGAVLGDLCRDAGGGLVQRRDPRLVAAGQRRNLAGLARRFGAGASAGATDRHAAAFPALRREQRDRAPGAVGQPATGRRRARAAGQSARRPLRPAPARGARCSLRPAVRRRSSAGAGTPYGYRHYLQRLAEGRPAAGLALEDGALGSAGAQSGTDGLSTPSACSARCAAAHGAWKD